MTEIHIHRTYRTSGAYAGHWFREVSVWTNGEWSMQCAPRAQEAARFIRSVIAERGPAKVIFC